MSFKRVREIMVRGNVVDSNSGVDIGDAVSVKLVIIWSGYIAPHGLVIGGDRSNSLPSRHVMPKATSRLW